MSTIALTLSAAPNLAETAVKAAEQTANDFMALLGTNYDGGANLRTANAAPQQFSASPANNASSDTKGNGDGREENAKPSSDIKLSVKSDTAQPSKTDKTDNKADEKKTPTLTSSAPAHAKTPAESHGAAAKILSLKPNMPVSKAGKKVSDDTADSATQAVSDVQPQPPIDDQIRRTLNDIAQLLASLQALTAPTSAATTTDAAAELPGIDNSPSAGVANFASVLADTFSTLLPQLLADTKILAGLISSAGDASAASAAPVSSDMDNGAANVGTPLAAAPILQDLQSLLQQLEPFTQPQQTFELLPPVATPVTMQTAAPILEAALPSLPQPADSIAQPILSDMQGVITATLNAVKNTLQKLPPILPDATPNPAPILVDQALPVQSLVQSLMTKVGVTKIGDSAAEPLVNNVLPTAQPAAPLIDVAAAPVIAPVETSLDLSQNNTGGDHNPDKDQAAPQSIIPLALNAQANAANAPIPASFAKIVNQITPAALTEQVMVHVKTAVQDGASKITIRLDPEELGKVDIHLDVSPNGKTVVTVTADNKATLDLLQRDQQGLARALADAGLKSDSNSLNFNLRGGQDQSQGQPRHQAAISYSKTQPEEDELIGPVLSRSYAVNMAQNLDISI